LAVKPALAIELFAVELLSKIFLCFAISHQLNSLSALSGRGRMGLRRGLLKDDT